MLQLKYTKLILTLNSAGLKLIHLKIMRLISLNTWCGIKYELLKKFLEHQSKDVDIFCFQEVRNGKYLDQKKETEEKTNLFKEMGEILPAFTGYFTEMITGVGIATFVRNNIQIAKIESKQILTAQEIEHIKMSDGNSYYPRVIQSIFLKNKNLVIHNFHGIPGISKKDTPERDLQTNNLLKIIDSNNSKSQIITGDFNLDINTEAISKLSNKLRNLIKESKFKTTRNYNYGKYKELPFADYAFISKDLKLNNFAVLPDEVSDHLALLVEFL